MNGQQLDTAAMPQALPALWLLVTWGPGRQHPQEERRGVFGGQSLGKRPLTLTSRPSLLPLQNGFDYLLTYSDNPQTVFPRYCVSWMVSSGESWGLGLSGAKKRRWADWACALVPPVLERRTGSVLPVALSG